MSRFLGFFFVVCVFFFYVFFFLFFFVFFFVVVVFHRGHMAVTGGRTYFLPFVQIKIKKKKSSYIRVTENNLDPHHFLIGFYTFFFFFFFFFFCFVLF